AYLRTLPIDVVKLAGEFIENIDGNLHDRLADEQIARAMIDLAHTLGLTVTAEQVETPGQAARLRALGCDAAQGWYFAKPLPPDKIATALGQRQRAANSRIAQEL
ncbi:MAG TPA: EAL domain-containing protein, partial [Mycobacterium sp.]